jgi:putative photosynthetic complex assembly protein
MSHDDFAFEPSPGLPAPLPKGESLLWQGTPDWKSLAIHAYHVRKVALYFLALMVWRVAYGAIQGNPLHDVLVSCTLLAVFGTLGVALLAMLAYFTARSTIYSVTSRRVLMRHGIAVPLTMNIPLTTIHGAAVKLYADGKGDIALATATDQRIGYLITWPHLRPGHVTRPQPSLRSIPDAARAAELLANALAAEANQAVATPALAQRHRMRAARALLDRNRQPLPDRSSHPFPGVPMPDFTSSRNKLPRALVMGAGGLVVASLLFVSVARLTGYRPAQPPASKVVEQYDLRFVDRTDGAVLIYSANDDKLVDTLQPGTNGFVRGVLRGLVRDRNADHVGRSPPFRLTRWADGRLSLDDPSTGRHIDLEVFGPTNAGAFADILIASSEQKDKS